MAAMPTRVDVYLDPACPFAWVTSRWLHEVARHRPLAIRTLPIGQHLVNADRDVGEAYRRLLDRSPAAARVFAATAAAHGDEVADALYTAFGEAMFTDANYELVMNSRRLVDRWSVALREAIAKALAGTGLDAALVEATDVTDYDDVLLANQGRAMAPVGDDVGTPVIHIDGRGTFGPVLTAIPRGRDAVELFDAVRRLIGYPHFFELKRTLRGGFTFG